jgi:hypothetical protein
MKAKQKFKTTTKDTQYSHYIHSLIPHITGTTANLSLRFLWNHHSFPCLSVYICICLFMTLVASHCNIISDRGATHILLETQRSLKLKLFHYTFTLKYSAAGLPYSPATFSTTLISATD